MTDAALARALAVLAVLTINHAFCRIFKTISKRAAADRTVILNC
jgi:hypothetical protein